MSGISATEQYTYQQSVIRGKYYPHIDGLRAFAVLAVLLYHAFPRFCPGGFLGVDVFFVISGYLITKGLLVDLEKGEYSIKSFYARRIRRIFPAYAAMILFSLLGGLLCFYGEKLYILAETACSSALFATNIYFANTSGYFSPGAHNNALLNLWSLSVEEQFYVFFPLFLAALHKWKPRYLIHFVWFVAVASFAMSVCAVNFNHYATAAFYWLPFRAWELLAGCLLAIHIRDRFIATRWAMAGLCVLCLCYWGINDAMPFPGAVAFIPVCCAVMILMSGHTKGVCSIMEHPAVVYIGKISYSLYLFHWPMIVFCRYVLYGYVSPLCANGIAIALSFFVSILSWKYIEMPLRRAGWSNGRLLKLGGIIICGVLVFAYLGRYLAIVEENHASVKVENYWDGETLITKKYPDPMWEECENRTPGSLVLLGREDTPPRYVLWGDSHAMALSPGFNAFSCRTGINGIYINRKHTLLEGTNAAIYPHNAQWIEDVLSWLQEHPELKNIVLVNRWAVRSQGWANESGQKVVYEREDGRGIDACEVFELGISQLCRRLRGMGKNVIIVSSIPEQMIDVPEMLQRFGLFGAKNERIGVSLQKYTDRQAETTETFLKLEKENLARILWVAPFFFDKGKSLPLLMPGGVSMYCDDDHLSPAGAKWLLEALGPQLIHCIE